MKKHSFIVAAFVSFSAVIAVAKQPAPVRVTDGLLQGVYQNGLTVYKGIPFAAPPVGDLRWRPPQPAAKWQGVRDADKFGPSPIQGSGKGPDMSEDCLYLNVWTPAKSASERLPVLVWIYGGGFNFGSTSDPMYDGANLARKGVVFVSIAYRLGELGFLADSQLTAESPHHVSGNYGILDMIAGLKWVRENIAAFGGNPHKVTIFGESAGGIAVSMLCASPLAKGLFQGAMSESGGNFGPTRETTYPGENLKTLAEAERDGTGYLKRAGVSSIAELRKIPADKLPPSRFGPGMAWPIMDGWVLPANQYELYEEGRFNDTPILVGYNSDEGASFNPPKTNEQYIAETEKRYGPFAKDLLEAYPAGTGTVVPKSARDLTRDAAFGWHTWIWARLEAEEGKHKAYLYYFDQHPDHPKGSPQYEYGSPHGQEVAYVFEHLNRSNHNVTKADRRISEDMAAYWTNFAKYGNPNGKGVPRWAAFNNGHPLVMYFHNTPRIGPVPDIKGLKTLNAYFKWRLTPEGKTWAK